MEILEKIVNTSKCFVKRRSCPVFGLGESVHVGRVLMTLENKFPMTPKFKNKLIMIRRHVPRIVIRRDIVANPWRGVKSNDFYDRFICNNVLCLRKGKILTFKVPHRPALLECNTMKILRQNIEIAHHTFLQVALGKKNGTMIFQKIHIWVVWRTLQLNLESRRDK